MTTPQNAPSGVHGDARTRILLHVAGSQHPTVRSCAKAAELRSVNTADYHLRILRDEGLVDWVDGCQGTLHATVRPVPYGPDAAA